MNCKSFQNERFDYVEGSLAPGKKRAADRHLAECETCRELLRNEQLVAETLSAGFRQSTEHAALPPDFAARLVSALRDDAPRNILPLPENPEPGWARFAWPVAIAAGVLLTSFGPDLLSLVAPAPRSAPSKAAAAGFAPDISVHYVYCAPAYTFRREGNRVVDALVCEPVTMDLTFHPEIQTQL